MNTGATNAKKVSKKQSAKERRINVIARLEAQLESKLKRAKGLFAEETLLPLEEKDIIRINQELKTLRERI